MENYLFVLFMCEFVVSDSQGCVIFTFPQGAQLESCMGKEQEEKHTSVSSSQWKVNSYIPDSTVTPFNRNCTTYIAPSEPYATSCSIFTLKLLSGGKLNFNVFIGAFPQSILCIKIFEKGKEDNIEWSNIKNGGWQQSSWSTITISLPNDISPKENYYTVMVIGISRETDIVRIESIKYISSEFDRICKTHSFNNEKELAKRLLSVTKTVVNANISSGDSIFINVREKKAIRTGKIKAYKYFEWWKCAKGRNIWQRKKKIMDKFYNEDVELCNKRLQQLKSIHRARTISFPNFRKKFGQRKDITQKSNQLLKQAINLANQEEKKYKKVSKIRDDLHLKREYVLNINENLYKVFEACRHENRTLHIVYRKLFNQYKKSVNIQINKTKEIENLNTELDEQKKKKETQIQLWYEADSQHEKSMKEEEERSERINKEMKEIATNILHLETEIIKKRSQLLDTTERLKSEENELEKIKDFGIELDVIEQEMNKTRDEIYANKKILQHWDDKLKKSAQNMDARQRQCANRRRRLPESEEKLSKETDKYIKLENIRSNLEDELKICQLNRIEKLEELKSSKKEMEKIREDYESNFAAITRKLEIEKHEIEEQSKEALRSLEKIEKETSQTVKNTERIQRELNSIIDMTRSLQKINKDIDTSLDKCQDAERKCHGELQNHDKKKETLLKKIEQIKKEGKDEEKNQVQQKILSEIEEKEKERFEIRVSQCKQRLQSLKERQEEEPNLRMDRKMYFWFALITILVVTAMLIFTVVFYLSQKSHTQS